MSVVDGEVMAAVVDVLPEERTIELSDGVGRVGLSRNLMWNVLWRAAGEHRGVSNITRRRVLRDATRAGCLAVLADGPEGEKLTVLCDRRRWKAYCRAHPEWAAWQPGWRQLLGFWRRW